jgi:hypothetical protein
MVSNVIKKMESISLQATQGIVLYEAIEAAQLEETLKNRLCEAVDNLLLQETIATTQPFMGAHTGQRLCNVFVYLTAEDWRKIDAPDASYWNIIYVVVERFKKIGMKQPMSECTAKWSAGSLVANCLERTGSMPAHDAIYQLTKDLKQALASCNVRCHPDLQAPKIYPDEPSRLGEQWLALAYGTDDPPVERYSTRVPGLVQSHIPVRETSNLLSWNSQKKRHAGQITAEAVAQEMLKQQAGVQLKMLKPAFGKKQDALQHSPDSKPQSDRSTSSMDASPVGSMSPEQRAIQLFEPKLRLSQRDEPMATTPPEVPVVLPGVTRSAAIATRNLALEDVQADGTKPNDGAGQLNTAEDFENAAFNALGGGSDTKKKPAANTTPKTSTSTKKRPSGAVKPTKAKSPKGLVLGCKSCRGTANGCKTCRKPAFTGWRGNREEYFLAGGK